MASQLRLLMLEAPSLDPQTLPGLLDGAECIRARSLEEAITLSQSAAPFTAVIGGLELLTELSACLSREVVRQQKLDTLHRAGQNLAALDADQLSEMNVETRIEYLKDNLRRTIHDLLHYDVIEIRLLNQQTGQLIPLLEEGMTEEAANRVLYASPEGNGVTGYVAATGLSYLCADTANDPLYITGSAEARSSLTVPLIHHDIVIGTFNIENPSADGFTAEDLQFTELFSREIAQSLHTLQLLSEQQKCTATQSINAINREMAMPLDEVLAMASGLLVKANGSPIPDADSAEVLQRIIANIRTIKQCVQKVGDDLAPLGMVPNAFKNLPVSKLKGMRILVVDNDEFIRRSAHSLLDRFGCQVETASTGAEGLAMAQTGPYDAVLADIRLPDMGGYDTYCRLKVAQPESRLMLMTEFGYDVAHSIVKARADGLRFVLFKPFRPEQVLNFLLAPQTTGRPEPIQVS